MPAENAKFPGKHNDFVKTIPLRAKWTKEEKLKYFHPASKISRKLGFQVALLLQACLFGE